MKKTHPSQSLVAFPNGNTWGKDPGFSLPKSLEHFEHPQHHLVRGGPGPPSQDFSQPLLLRPQPL